MSPHEPAVQALARQWGFIEDPVLLWLRKRIVATIISGQPAQELWREYIEISEHYVSCPEDGHQEIRAKAGRQIVQGLIYLEAEEVVRGLNCLLFAETIARNESETEAEKLLTTEVAKHGSQAQQLHAAAYSLEDAQDYEAARNKYEAALSLYLEAEGDTSLTVADHGRIDYQVAECYLSLLQIGAPDVKFVQQQMAAALKRAAANLQGTAWLARAEALLGRVSQEGWWRAAVEQQQA